MTWWIIGVIVFLVLVRWLLRPVKPTYHRNLDREGIEKFIRDLWNGAGNGTLLIFDHDDFEGFMRIQKSLKDNKKTYQKHLSFDIPAASVSELSRKVLTNKLEAEGIRTINRIRDIDKAIHIANTAVEVLGYGAADSFTAHFEGFPSIREYKKYVMEQVALRDKEK